jgi:hypothetical protein
MTGWMSPVAGEISADGGCVVMLVTNSSSGIGFSSDR